MVTAWLRSLLIFDGFLPPDSAVAVLSAEQPVSESWLLQLLALDGFIKKEQQMSSDVSASQVPTETKILQASTLSLPVIQGEKVAPETPTVPLSMENSEPEIYPHSEEALSDWQRILGWKE